MSYPDKLVAHARHLLGRNRTKPQQVDLRRAVSAAYYAVFHALTQQAAARAVGSTAAVAFATAVARSFEHSGMRSAADDMAKQNPSAKTRPLLDGVALSSDIRTICQRFSNLQVLRHRADYDLSSTFNKADAVQAVDDADDTLKRVDQLKRDPAFARCLFALHSYRRLRPG